MAGNPPVCTNTTVSSRLIRPSRIQPDQAGETLRAVDGIHEQALGPKEQVERFPRGFGHHSVLPSALAIVVDDAVLVDQEGQTQQTGCALGKLAHPARSHAAR